MAEYTLMLKNGETALVDTTLSINRLRDLRDRDVISKDLLRAMISGTKDGDPLDLMDDAADGVYAAYVNANFEDHMEKVEFFDLLTNDLIQNMQIYGEVVGGPTLGKKFSESFQNVTKKN